MTPASLRKLFDEQYPGQQEIEIKGECHYCKKEVIIKIKQCDEGFIVEGGAIYEPQTEQYFLKCDECYKIDPVLRNFQKTTIYSRIVGYLTPINQWNEGKKAEFSQRKTFNLEQALNAEIKTAKP